MYNLYRAHYDTQDGIPFTKEILAPNLTDAKHMAANLTHDLLSGCVLGSVEQQRNHEGNCKYVKKYYWVTKHEKGKPQSLNICHRHTNGDFSVLWHIYFDGEKYATQYSAPAMSINELISQLEG